MGGIGKKGPVFASPDAARLLNQLSKQALLDMCWTFAQLGTDESAEQILTKICREAAIVLAHRGDRIPNGMLALAAQQIDSDPPG